MRRLTLFALTVLFLTPVFMPGAQARDLPKPELIAVYFYADWCPNCQILSPEIQKARMEGALDKENILFVTFDLTDKTTIHQSILLAQALGLGEYMKAQGSATGYMAVLDAQTKEEKLRFSRDDQSGQILSGIKSLTATPAPSE